jgi:hypothetical protein
MTAAMDDKLKRIAVVLANLSEHQRLSLIREMTPPAYVLVSIHWRPEIADAFRNTATRLHTALAAPLRFDARIIQPCWTAMIAATENGS